MKNIFLLTLFYGVFFTSTSQPYHKLIRPGTYWDCSWAYNPTGGPGCATTIDRIFFTNADTLLEGITYKISYAFPMHSDPPNPGQCPPYAIDNVIVDFKTYIREDTIARKVYIYYPIFNYPSDQILYDFALQPGDSLKSTYQGNHVVTTVDSVMLLTGEFRKRFIYVVSTWWSGYYVEGVGGSQGLFTPIFTSESYGVFLCLKENNVNLWGSSCNSWFVNVSDHDISRPTIYPNPASGKTTIDFKMESPVLKNIELTDIMNVKLLEVETHDNKVMIDMENYSPGIYVVKIIMNNLTYIKKVCKK